MFAQINIFLSLAISFTIAFFVIPKIIKVSVAKNLFDVPNHRSAAKKVIPTLGGIAIVAGFLIGTIISSDSFDVNALKYMYAGLIAMFLIGLKDDIIGMSAKKKFIIEIVMALYMVILGHYRITNLHGLFGIHEIGYLWGLSISTIAIVGIINAVNLVDGIDGLSGGIGLLASLIYGFWFLNAGDPLYALCSFSLAGSLIAFLLYNVFGDTNKIFMGDTGSLVLGTILAILTIHFNLYYPTATMAGHGMPAISLAILIVPVIDTTRVFAIRLWQRRSPFSPDMNHIHHNVLKLTGSHLISSLIIISVNGLIVLLAFLLIGELGNNHLFVLLLALGYLLAGIPAFLVKMNNTARENKSIFAISIFMKKSRTE
ncbi:MAG TPA: MraY family glycosyltransferase [Prolixibacteraceae bacterium]|nr:MraY family glycosyltransferase [Prolixibacteraceae bacterium]